MTGALLTDLYQLTMLQAYFDRGMNDTATFEFFVRKLPAQRNFLMAAGLEQVIDYLSALRFAPDEIGWLAGTNRFRPEFLRSLEDLRFTGDAWAMPEGTVFFPDEPILRITAPMREAQLVESRIINLLHYETLVASKAARCVVAAAGKLLVDFGLRRAHAAEAGLLSARASFLAGFSGTATVEAGMRFAIPIYGTMAHSYVQAHEDEAQAFEDFARSQPDNVTLLIDTYDTEAAAHKVVALAAKLAESGITIRAVRIDSGDLGAHARRVRAILDAGGLSGTGVFASGNLDEYKLRELLQSGSPIDGFGVGTRMNTSADAPYLDCAYKLTEYAGLPRRKRSEGKATWPGRKQVYRRFDAEGVMTHDVLTLHDDDIFGTPLLEPVVLAGKRRLPAPDLQASRDHARRQLAALPERLRALETAELYPVQVSGRLAALAQSVDARTRVAAPSTDAGRAVPEEPVSIQSKVAALSQPAAYAANPETVKVIETHMSWVFLAGPMAYKLKKPVLYGRLDFRTLEARRFYCMEELRLNRRLAESVYLDVIPLKLDSGGALRIDATGTVVDWLVMMRRLPAELMLDRMLEEGKASADDMRALAARLAGFYRSLPPAPIGRSQYLNRLAGEIDECERELCDPAFDLETDPVRSLCNRLRSVLRHRADLFTARIAAGKIVEGHGDLRPEHVYLGTPPAVIDRLEFSADLRILDVVDELGFLALECERLGSPELGRVLLESYGQSTGDTAGVPLIHFYQCLRACIRAKITIWHLREARYRESAKWLARTRQYLGFAARHMQSCEPALLPQTQGPADKPTLPAAA